MSFSVEDKLVKRQNTEIIAEQQVQVLQGFRKVERLHLVRMLWEQNVWDCRIALGKLCVFLEGTKDVPAPRPVDGVLGQSVHVEETLNGLRPMDVVSVVELLHT